MPAATGRSSRASPRCKTPASRADRADWAEGLGLKDLTKEKAEVIFHAGCRYSFDGVLRLR